MFWETNNSYKPDTEVKEEFRPEAKKVFGVKSFDVPVEEVHVVDSMSGNDILRSQVLIEKDGKKYFRFFVHPESEHLYIKLMKKYGAQELYWARATASTRGLLAWPKNPADGNPLFLKLSLAKIQDQLGRIIAGWEVRRSVGIAELAENTPHETWMKSGASIIPEVMGAYVDKKEKLGFYVDEKQGKVAEHGLIIRDASFLQEAEKNGWEARPLFSLFVSDGKKPPHIIEMWKKSGKEFIPFLEDFLFKPFIEKNRHLFYGEHIVPEIHGQNVVVAIDPKTGEIAHFYHRDVGSMKVDLRMRWIDGKNVEPLRSPNAAYDYKFQRATSAIEDVYHHYLNDWLFRWTYQDELKKWVPGFSPDQTLASLRKLIREDARAQYPLKKGESNNLTITDRLEKYIDENPPKLVPLKGPLNPNLEKYLSAQEKAEQFMPLPDTWIKKWKLKPGDIVPTSQGVVKVAADGTGKIYFHASRDLHEVMRDPVPVVHAVAKTTPKAVNLDEIKGPKRIGFYSGTFDPPHAGHKKLIDEAMAKYNLDAVYILPTPTPDHKPGATPYELRRKMAMAAFKDPKYIVADAELAKVAEEQGIGGLQRFLAQKFSKDQVFQVMGADAVERMLGNPAISFPKNFSVIVGDRSGTEFKIPKKTNAGNPILLLDSEDNLGVSSTKIREAVEKGLVPAHVEPAVLKVIQENSLYGYKPAEKAMVKPSADSCERGMAAFFKGLFH